MDLFWYLEVREHASHTESCAGMLFQVMYVPIFVCGILFHTEVPKDDKKA